MKITTIFFGILLAINSYALTFTLPENGDTVVGKAFVVEALPNDSIRIIGRRYDMGYEQMVSANPNIPPNKYIATGTKIIIPAKFVLPPGPKKGIVVNASEFRLYYYLPDGKSVMTFPTGIGKSGWQTPTFDGTITKKAKNPVWLVPQSIIDYQKTQGVDLPKILRQGPRNPLGQFALYTSNPGYLLHGTNRPLGVGSRVSSGCIRILPEDIEQLYTNVPAGTTIRVIHTPDKLGKLKGKYYLEAHTPLEDYDADYVKSITPAINMITSSVDDNSEIDWDKVLAVLTQHDGIPQDVSANETNHS